MSINNLSKSAMNTSYLIPELAAAPHKAILCLILCKTFLAVLDLTVRMAYRFFIHLKALLI